MEQMKIDIYDVIEQLTSLKRAVGKNNITILAFQKLHEILAPDLDDLQYDTFNGLDEAMQACHKSILIEVEKLDAMLNEVRNLNE